MTSHDVVAIVRRALGMKSVGHTGTLDPFATGLLILLVGKATRLARFLDDLPKVYRGVVRLGQGSDTDDATGSLGPQATGHGPQVETVRAALATFVGTQMQTPPAYSAKKIDGERAYKRAREGEAVVLKPVEVTIHAAELLRYEWPDAEIRVRVSTGTYVRSLARDLGTKLGMPAHCAELRREGIGSFKVDDAVSLEAVQSGGVEGWRGGRRTMLDLVPHLPRQILDDEGLAHIKHGRRIPTTELQGPISLIHGDELMAVAEVVDGMAQPVVVLAE